MQPADDDFVIGREDSSRPESRRRRPRPRNYLSRPEQRRLFWMVMPPAVLAVLVGTWIERRFRPPPEPGPAQVDTVLHEAADRPGLEGLVDPAATQGPGDVVLIDPVEESPSLGGLELGANARALAAVQDDTVFRESDSEAWFGLFETLRSASPQSLLASHPTTVGFNELFAQPESFRGRLVRFKGSIRRLEWVAAPTNSSNIDGYWQAWLRPHDGPPSPIVVYFLEPPVESSIRAGEQKADTTIDLPVEVLGYFFKRWAYRATDAIRTAPLVVARSPLPLAKPAPSSSTAWFGLVIMAFMAAMVGAASASLWLLNRRAAGQRPRTILSTVSRPPMADGMHSTTDVHGIDGGVAELLGQSANALKDPPES